MLLEEILDLGERRREARLSNTALPSNTATTSNARCAFLPSTSILKLVAVNHLLDAPAINNAPAW